MPFVNIFGDFMVFNMFVTAARESWRLKYYEWATYGHSPVLNGFDGRGNSVSIYLPTWLPKYKAVAERKIHLNRMRILYKELFEPDDLSGEQN